MKVNNANYSGDHFTPLNNLITAGEGEGANQENIISS